MDGVAASAFPAAARLKQPLVCDADALDQRMLGFTVVDLAFLVLQQFLEELHGHIVACLTRGTARLPLAMGR